MQKKSINLIIKKEGEKLLFRRLKIILPALALLSLIVFITSWIVLTVYLNNNLSQFNQLKAQVQQLERQIADRKSIEGIYTLSLKRLELIGKLTQAIRNYERSVNEVNKLRATGVEIGSVSIGQNGNFSFSVSAYSLSTLEALVSYLLAQEESEIFSNILAQNIYRDKTGKYTFIISAKPNPSFYQ